MTTFKPGDRVQTVAESWGDDIAPIGALGTVVKVPSGISVCFDGVNGDTGSPFSGWAMMPKQLRHVRRFAIRKRPGADKPWRVLVESQGQQPSMIGAFHSFAAAQGYLAKFRLQMGRQ